MTAAILLEHLMKRGNYPAYEAVCTRYKLKLPDLLAEAAAATRAVDDTNIVKMDSSGLQATALTFLRTITYDALREPVRQAGGDLLNLGI